MRFFSLFIICSILCSCSKEESNSVAPILANERSFFMGFTAFPYDNSLEAQQESFLNVVADGDLFLNHLDHGIPWDEVYNDAPFPDEVQNTIADIRIKVGPNTKVFLTATPTDQNRKNLANYWNNNGTHQPLPTFWQNKAFDDVDVVETYIKYCKRLINEVQPDYFAYGIETNATFRKDDIAFVEFLTLADSVYSALKADFPDLPIFLTVQDQSFENTKEELLETTRMLLSYSDYIAISTYPFLYYQDIKRDANPDLFEDNWLDDFRNIDPAKPFAISETGFCAQDLVIPNLGIDVKGTEEWQAAYLNKLFQQANTLDAEFVAWFVYRDYDLLYDKTTNPPDILKVWRDNGLLDGEGNQRSSYQIWKEWKELSKE